MEIKVVENVLKLNDEVALLNRVALRQANVKCVNLMGGPGCGKTALLERTLEALRDELRIGVLTGDLTTTRDAERLARHCEHVSQINTGKSCHLDANQVRQGMGTLPLDELDLLVVENVGNLICPVGFDIGQDAKIGMFSVTEGEDKAAKHPYIVLEASVLLVNKIDLLPHVPFDMDAFLRDIAAIRSDVPVLRLSAATGAGIETWLDWLRALVRAEAGAPVPVG
jgi:hydrogenase nickel incorporation protein HypB